MAMLNWQGWAATNFQGWGSVGTATPAAPTPSVGGGGGRRGHKPVSVKYKGREHFFASENDAEQFVAQLQKQAEKKPVKQVQKQAQKHPEAPVAMPVLEMQAPPDMSHLRAMVDAYNARLAAEHQAAMLAYEIEQDDADIFALLQLIDD